MQSGNNEFYDDDENNDDDEGLPAYSHQSYSHLVGICHNDEGGNMTQSHSHHVKIHHLYIDDHFEGK